VLKGRLPHKDAVVLASRTRFRPSDMASVKADPRFVYLRPWVLSGPADFPNRTYRYGVDHMQFRKVVAFPKNAITFLLAFLVSSPRKYTGDRWEELYRWVDPVTGEIKEI
jgi:hypothetical protein